MDMRVARNGVRQKVGIHEIVAANHRWVVKYILFAHTFTGCDTTSAIFNYGKVKILAKIKSSSEVRAMIDNFYEDDIYPEKVGDSSVKLFEILFSNKQPVQLKKLRLHRYQEMVSKPKIDIDPSGLPPSPRAAYYHGLRVYHQIMVWKKLSPIDLDPLSWGWTV